MPDADHAVVLVADGDKNVLQDVSSTLDKAGFTVLTALNRAAVLDLSERHREPIQLAIVDAGLAGDGAELVERLCRSYPGIRILFTSGKGESEPVPGVGRSGRMREFLQKPFRRSQLLGRVLQVMDAPMVFTA
jgi:DNA-binding response OmpR family regulator